jgi:hypothetical protein
MSRDVSDAFHVCCVSSTKHFATSIVSLRLRKNSKWYFSNTDPFSLLPIARRLLVHFLKSHMHLLSAKKPRKYIETGVTVRIMTSTRLSQKSSNTVPLNEISTAAILFFCSEKRCSGGLPLGFLLP